ncbi:MAG: hypothetical protein ACLFNU_11350 [Bacteroidales bacterium]
MKRVLPIILLAVTVVFTGCVSKRLAKRGLKFEQSGMYEMAADMFYQSINANPKNVDAAVGLKKNGQRVLDDKTHEVNKSYFDGDDKQTVYNFLDAKEYHEKIAEAGINLDLSRTAQSYFDEAKPRYLESLYNEARILLDEEKFRESEAKFTEIKNIDPEFQGIDEFMKVSKAEPAYREGLSYLTNEQYRKAYHSFNGILINLGNYKDTKDLRDEALLKGMLTISIGDFENKTRQGDIAVMVESRVESAINNLQNPFIRVVDSENIDQFIEQQAQGTTLGSDIQVGKLFAAKAILNGSIIRHNVSRGKVHKTERRGYVKEVVTTKDRATGTERKETKYHKVVYHEVTQANSVTLSFQYRLSSTETGAVLVSDALNLKQNDKVHYVIFNGDKSKLVPGYWEHQRKDSPKDKIEDKFSAVRELQKLVDANREIKPVETLQEEMLNNAANKVASKINAYNPDN